MGMGERTSGFSEGEKLNSRETSTQKGKNFGINPEMKEEDFDDFKDYDFCGKRGQTYIENKDAFCDRGSVIDKILKKNSEPNLTNAKVIAAAAVVILNKLSDNQDSTLLNSITPEKVSIFDKERDDFRE